MLGIIEEYNEFKESTHFTKLKDDGRFAIYAFGIYLAATFTVGCLGLIIGSTLLTLPLAMLIFHPVAWILMGIVLTVIYKMVVELLFHWVKGYVDGKGASKEKESNTKTDELSKSPEQEQAVNNQGNPKTQDGDSGIVPGSEPDSRNSSRRSSLDSGLGGKEFHENLDTLVHQTNRKNYSYWLDDNDITHIARVVYKYSKNGHSNNNVYFLTSGYSDGWDEITRQFLQNYRGELEQNPRLIFTSVFHINNNHWVTLVIKPDAGNKKFRAYYCDSFGDQLPNNLLDIVKGELQKGEWILDIKSSRTPQQSDGHNCGIFALENARMITEMLKEDKLFDQIDVKLSKYTPNSKQLEEKRREFAEALMNDEKWKEDLRGGLLCNLPRTATSLSSTSEVQHAGSFCNIM
ncbi:Ulp1 family isopeptidase [Wolbachia endosymbiont of Armadillidium arcangelii]|uniref:Ulp1 family isopeptidase n=1 Tax=Wolbachia endosymbiont of Armadillidium arcangelii TaxID=3158571 RepID=A0AAU7Q3B5_9RICK